MSKVTIAVDLAKDVFEIAVANPSGTIIERKRLTRPQFERFWQRREPCSVVMEACGSAHHWARMLVGLGFEVRLLPAHYVRPYRQRNKTDRADCEALLEAARSPRIKAVGVKSQDQQAILALHRVCEQWKSTRTMRINGMRGLLREFFALSKDSASPLPRGPGSSSLACRSSWRRIGSGFPSGCAACSLPSGRKPATSTGRWGRSRRSWKGSLGSTRSSAPCWRSPASAPSPPPRSMPR